MEAPHKQARFIKHNSILDSDGVRALKGLFKTAQGNALRIISKTYVLCKEHLNPIFDEPLQGSTL